MNVASAESCKELYELSAWMDTGISSKYETWKDSAKLWRTFGWFNPDTDYPAYDLGYLLRKLPPQLVRKNGGVTKRWHLHLEVWTDIVTDEPNGWVASYQSNRNDTGVYVAKGREMIEFSDTPQNAVANLAIELFKRRVLQKENS